MLVQRSSARSVTSMTSKPRLPREEQHVGDEVDLVAVVARVVAGGGVGAAGEEQVREAVGLHAEEGPRAVRPVVRQSASLSAPDAHPGQGARPEVESRRPHDDVELPAAVGGLDARRRHPHDRRLAEVDQGDVRAVERLEVPGDERAAASPRSGGPSGMSRSAVSGSWTMLRILSAMKAHHSALASGLESRSSVVARQLREPGAVPHRLVEPPALLLGVLEGGPVVGWMVEPVHRGVERVRAVVRNRPAAGPARRR